MGTLATPDSTAAALQRNIVLSIRDLAVGHGSQPVLKIERLDAHTAEVLAIVGRSGCGKTTLLTCLSRDLRPIAGTFYLDSHELGRGLRNTYTSRTLQAFPLLHWLTVKENLALAARVRGVPKPDFDQILSNFAAESLWNRMPSGLSGGERCRASLSQALLGDPKLLLLDEPFSGLDLGVKQVVAGNLFRLARESGATVLIVTHDWHDALEFSDRIIAIGGRGPAGIAGEISPKEPNALESLRRLMAEPL